MRLIFKILAAPLVVVLAIGTPVLAFLCGVGVMLVYKYGHEKLNNL